MPSQGKKKQKSTSNKNRAKREVVGLGIHTTSFLFYLKGESSKRIKKP